MLNRLGIALLCIVPCFASLAQQGHNILMGSRELFNFTDTTLQVDTLASPGSSSGALFQYSFSDCSGNYLGNTSGYIKRNDSLVHIANPHYYDTFFLSCARARTNPSYEIAAFPSDRSSLVHSLFATGINPDSVYYTYSSWRLQNDSAIYSTIQCHVISDSFENAHLISNERYQTDIVGNSQTIWCIKVFQNKVLSFEVKDNGILNYKRSTKQGIRLPFSFYPAISTIKANNSGLELAIIEDDGVNVLNLYNFDKTTGTVSYNKPLLAKSRLPSYNYCTGSWHESIVDGMAFSPNDSILYVGYTHLPICSDYLKVVQQIYQINRYDADPSATAKVIFSKLYTNTPSTQYTNRQISMFTGPDGIIYWGGVSDSAIHTITNSNVYGGAVVHANKYVISGNVNAAGVRSSPSTYKWADFDAFSSCADTSKVVFYGSDNLLKVTYTWGDGDSTIYHSAQQANGMQSSHMYDSTGVYTITQKSLFNDCGFTVQKSKPISVTSPPRSLARLVAADTQCTVHTILFTDTVSNSHKLEIAWGDGTIDSLTLDFARATPVAFSHSYTTQDTFTISYSLIGFGLPNEGKQGCQWSIDTAYHSIFHPIPRSTYALLQPADTILLQPDGSYSMCAGNDISIIQTNDSFTKFIATWGASKDTSIRLAVNNTLAQAKAYTVPLEAYTANGCVVRDTLKINTLPRPTAMWQGDSSVCVGDVAVMKLHVASSSGLDSISYAQTKTSLSDSATYTVNTTLAGVQNLLAVSYSPIGCIDTWAKKINVWSLPLVQLSGDSLLCIDMLSEYIPLLVSLDSVKLIWAKNTVRQSESAYLPSNNHLPFNLASATAGVTELSAAATTLYGCSDTANMLITISAPPILACEDSLRLCFNEQPLTISITGTSTESGKLYMDWQDGNVDSFVLSAGNIASVLEHNYAVFGTYTATIVGNNNSNCSDTIALNIKILDVPTMLLSAADVCEGDSTPITLQINSNQSLNSVQIQINDTQIYSMDSAVLSKTFTKKVHSPVGKYSVLGIAQTKTMCSDSASVHFEVLDRPTAALTFLLSKNSEFGVSYLFIDHSLAHTSSWLAYGDSTHDLLPSGFSQTHSYSDTGWYIATLVASNRDLCFDTAYYPISAFPFIDFYIPNAISPNGDLRNNYLNIKSIFIAEIHVEIYNRWGEKIMELNNLADLKNRISISWCLSGYIHYQRYF